MDSAITDLMLSSQNARTNSEISLATMYKREEECDQNESSLLRKSGSYGKLPVKKPFLKKRSATQACFLEVVNSSDYEECGQLTDFNFLKAKSEVKMLVNAINASFNLIFQDNNRKFKRDHQTTVYVSIIILKIGEIETADEKFQADAYIECYWNDDTLDSSQVYDSKLFWNPNLHIENTIGELKQEINHRTEMIDNTCRVYEARKIKGVFWERMELYDFPIGIFKCHIYQFF